MLHSPPNWCRVAGCAQRPGQSRHSTQQYRPVQPPSKSRGRAVASVPARSVEQADPVLLDLRPAAALPRLLVGLVCVGPRPGSWVRVGPGSRACGGSGVTQGSALVCRASASILGGRRDTGQRRDQVRHLPPGARFGASPTADGRGGAAILPSRGTVHEKGEALPTQRKNRASDPTGPREPSPDAHPAPRSRPFRDPPPREAEPAQPQVGSEPGKRSRRTRGSRAGAAAGRWRSKQRTRTTRRSRRSAPAGREDPYSPGASSSARWRAGTWARSSSWVRQEKPSARTTAPSPIARSAGMSCSSATATDVS